MLNPAARNTDPITSHMAEKEVTVTGTRVAQMMRVVKIVEQHVGYTSAELAKKTGEDRYMLARRLSDARDLNFVENGGSRKCGESGRMAMTWYPGTMKS